MALQDASSELKELKEVVESVSTENYVFVILYYSNYTVFELDSSFNSYLIRQSFTIIFSTTRFILFKSCSIRQSPLFSSPPFSSATRFIPFPLHLAPIPFFLGLFLTPPPPPPPPPPWPLSPPPPPPSSLANSLVLFFIVFFIARKKGTSKNTCYKWRLKLRCIENILKGSKWCVI